MIIPRNTIPNSYVLYGLFLWIGLFSFGLSANEEEFGDIQIVRIGQIADQDMNLVSQEILTEAYRRIGYKTRYFDYPGRRSLIEVSGGRIDGELFRIKGMEKKYPNLIMIPVPVNEIQSMVITKNKDIKVNGWESLRGYKAGVLRGIKYSEEATSFLERIIVESNSELFSLLDKDLIDFFVFNKASALKTFKEQRFDDFHIVEPPIARYKLYHYLNSRHAELAQRVTKTLKDMKNEGIMDKVIESQFNSVR